MQPLITIGIASYNYERETIKALEAISRQDFLDYEVLISDDCSNAHCVAQIKRFIDTHTNMNIRLLESKKNEGIIANKNKIIKNCKGKYLMLCDADDWMDDRCLKKIADVIKKEDPDRVLVEVAHIDEQGKIIQVEHLDEHQTKWGWNIFHGSVFKVSIIREHNMKINRIFDDIYFTIEFSKYVKKLSMIQEPLYYWLVHWDSAGRSIPEDTIHRCYTGILTYIGSVIRYVEKRKDENFRQDQEELRLILLKLYYFMILFYFQPYSLRDKLMHYRAIHQVIRKVDPAYLNNQFLSASKKPPLRPYALRAIKLCAMLEKLHLMPFALVGYHVLTKVKRFDQ